MIELDSKLFREIENLIISLSSYIISQFLTCAVESSLFYLNIHNDCRLIVTVRKNWRKRRQNMWRK